MKLITEINRMRELSGMQALTETQASVILEAKSPLSKFKELVEKAQNLYDDEDDGAIEVAKEALKVFKTLDSTSKALMKDQKEDMEHLAGL